MVSASGVERCGREVRRQIGKALVPICVVIGISACDPAAPVEPTILTFNATPSAIDYGNSSTLTWTTDDAKTCSIDGGVGDVPCNGTTDVSPEATTTYRLMVSSDGGESTRTVDVTVNAPAITSVGPDSGSPGDVVVVDITGTGFSPNTTVAVSGGGVTASAVQVAGPTSLQVTLTIAANALIGDREVTVGAAGGSSSPAVFSVVPSAASLSAPGPYEVATFTALPAVAEFPSAIVHYAMGMDAPMGIVAASPGRYGTAESDLADWAERIASYGFAVISVNPFDPATDNAAMKAFALGAALELMQAENEREDSPLYDRLDPEKLAMFGYSLGATAALIVANVDPAAIDAVIMASADAPAYGPSAVTAPSMIMTSQNDAVAPPAPNGRRHYDVIPETTPKVYMEVAGGDHFVFLGPETLRLARFAVAWLKLHVDGEEIYRPFATGPSELDTGFFSDFLMSD